MRTFKLINNDGAEYDITIKNRAFLHTVSGLGYERDMDFLRIADRYAMTSNYLSQCKVEGNVYFGGSDNVNDYFDFANFCENAPLKLSYNPGHSTFLRNGYIQKIERNDGDNVKGALITFVCTTPWYKEVSAYNTGHVGAGTKKYNYEYNYVYSDHIDNTISMSSNSYLSSPMRLAIYGPVTNPIWRHYSNNKLIATGKITGTIPSGHKLVIDTTTIPYTIHEVDLANQFIADKYQASDFNTERFFTLKYGTNTFTVSAEGASTISLALEAQIEYATV